MNLLSKKLSSNWIKALKDTETVKLTDKDIKIVFGNIKRDIEKGETIYPPSKSLFKTFKFVQPWEVKVCIVGKNPYSGGQADGLAFSSNNEQVTPYSLDQILQEVELYYKDSSIEEYFDRGYSPSLDRWAKQGVILLNSSLTVLKGKPSSHLNIGWQEVTKALIRAIDWNGDPKAFLFLGAEARKLKSEVCPFCDNLILESIHPDAVRHGGVLNLAEHFHTINQFLKTLNKEPIKW